MHRRVYLLFSAALFAVAVSACGGNSSTPPTFVVSGLGTPSSSGVYTLAAAAQYPLTAKETASGGSPVTPGPLTITFSSATIGTATGDTVTAGLANATGIIKVVDSKTGLGQNLNVVVLSTHPATAGDTLTLEGTLTHTISRPQPAPSAVAAPTTTTTAVTDTLKIASLDAPFNGSTGLTDNNVVEADAAPLQTITTTSDTYTHFVADGSLQQYLGVGYTSTDSNNVQDEVVYGTGAGIFDELPDTNGATFANTAAQTFAELEPDGTTVARTVTAGGTYAETDTFVAGSPQAIQTNADLSGSITNLGGLAVNVTYGAPTGTPATIAYNVVYGGSSLAAGTLPSWLPTTKPYTDLSTKTTAQAFPSACAVPSSVGTTGTEIVDVTTRLDTALGTYEKRTQTLFNAPGYGTVCAQLADEIDTYYDYTGQSYALVGGLNLAISSTPIQIDTLAETIGFTSGTINGSSTSRSAAQTRALSTTSATRIVAPLFDRAIQAVYRARRDAALSNISARRAALAKVTVR
jgi:hypothetical protein